MLTITTHTPAPRRIGGGLDDPNPRSPQGRRGRLPTPGRERRPAPAPERAPRRPTHNRPERLPELTPVRRPHADRVSAGEPPGDYRPPNVELPVVLPSLAIAPAAADELAAVRAELAALVPVGESVGALRLVGMVAAKLAGHGAHCALAINPPRGSLTLDEARARCRAVLDSLRPVERRAVISLLAADEEEVTR